MNTTAKALAMVGMTPADMERTDFSRRVARKASAALRSMGYTQERFATYAGNGRTRWAKDGVPPTMEQYPAFDILIMAIARSNG